MLRGLTGAFCAAFAVAATALPAVTSVAQEAPALTAAAPAERARLLPIIEAAKQEGSLTYWDVVIQPETNDELVAAFHKRYGLPASFQVHYNLASGPAFVTRLDQEIAAGKVTVDVGAFSVLSWVYARVRAGDLLEYQSPEYAHYRQAIDAGIARQGYFAPNGGYIFVPMWSEDHLKFNGTSYNDVLTAVPAGRIIAGDAAKAAPQLAFYTGLRNALSADYFRKLAAMKPSFIIRSEQVAARLVSGEDLMAFGGMPSRAYQSNQKGAHLKFMLPKEGVMLMPQGTFILKRAPHPNAAKLWIDFILSEEGQTILVKHEALISARSGFKSPVPDYAPAIDALKLIKMDWSSLTEEDLAKKKAEWLGIFQP